MNKKKNSSNSKTIHSSIGQRIRLYNNLERDLKCNVKFKTHSGIKKIFF